MAAIVVALAAAMILALVAWAGRGRHRGRGHGQRHGRMAAIMAAALAMCVMRGLLLAGRVISPRTPRLASCELAAGRWPAATATTNERRTASRCRYY